MGCGGSKAASPAPPSPLLLQSVDGLIVVAPAAPHLLAALAYKPEKHVTCKGKGKGKGKGVGKGVGKGMGKGMGLGKGKGKGSGNKWQIMLDGKFQDYGIQEDSILKRAYMIGHQHAKFQLRGQSYEYNFKKMIQKNKDSGKERQVRPPLGWVKPKKPLLPQGPMIIITVGSGQPGTMIDVKDPNNPGQHVQVYVPAHARPGQKMAVPIPAKGQSVESVQQKQKEHDAEHGTMSSRWTTGGKMAAGGAAVLGVAAVGVGGVILGDHHAGGDIADTIAEVAADAGEWATDAAGDAADWVADAAGDAGEWLEGDAADWAADAAGDAGDWAADATGDAGEWLEGAGEEVADFAGDAADWLGDAGEDIGDFVMDLF